MRNPIAAALVALLLITCNGQARAGIERKPTGQREDWAAQSARGTVENPFALPEATAKPMRLAHAILVKANPEREATISDAPDEVLLIFNDSVGQEFLALAVIDPSGKRVDNHDAKLDFTDHSHLRASVSKLAPGRYTVRYRVLSADGHVVSGKYFFDVQGK
jgi:methionine-rich copper-binding protein CopC